MKNAIAKMAGHSTLAEGDVVTTACGASVRIDFTYQVAEGPMVYGRELKTGKTFDIPMSTLDAQGRRAEPPRVRTAIRNFVEKAHAAAPFPVRHLEAAITIAEHLAPLGPSKDQVVGFARGIADLLEIKIANVTMDADFEHTGIIPGCDVMTVVREEPAASVEINGTVWSAVAYTAFGAHVRVNLGRNGFYGGVTRATWIVCGDKIVRTH